jgi:hypothetical protein
MDLNTLIALRCLLAVALVLFILHLIARGQD